MLMSAWRLQGVLRNQNVNRLRKDLLFDKESRKKCLLSKRVCSTSKSSEDTHLWELKIIWKIIIDSIREK